MAEIEPRDVGGRGIADSSDRSVAPARDAIAPRGVTNAEAQTVDAGSRYVAPARNSIMPRDYSRGLAESYDVGTAGDVGFAQGPLNGGLSWFIDAGGTPAIDTTNKSDAPTALYGTDSPLAILADLFGRGFGLQSDNTPQTEYVPLTGSSSVAGGSAGLIVILLLALGAAYYFFIYKKAGA